MAIVYRPERAIKVVPCHRRKPRMARRWLLCNIRLPDSPHRALCFEFKCTAGGSITKEIAWSASTPASVGLPLAKSTLRAFFLNSYGGSLPNGLHRYLAYYRDCVRRADSLQLPGAPNPPVATAPPAPSVTSDHTSDPRSSVATSSVATDSSARRCVPYSSASLISQRDTPEQPCSPPVPAVFV